jgi:hypothetical protein
MRTIRIFVSIAIAASLSLGGPLPSIAAENEGTISGLYCTAFGSSADNPGFAAGGIDVLYLNGITNSIEEALESQKALRLKIISRLSSVYPVVRVGGIYNPTGGWSYDSMELRDQAQIENRAREETTKKSKILRKKYPDWSEDIFQKFEESYYLDRLAELTIAYFLDSKFFDQDGSIENAAGGDGSDSEFIGSVILKVVAAIEERLLSGRRVVVVAHSQGNHFIQAAHALLRNRLSYEQLEGLQVVGVAVVSATTPNDKWVTIAQDDTVYGWYAGEGWNYTGDSQFMG